MAEPRKRGKRSAAGARHAPVSTVGVFWDFENCPPPMDVAVEQVVEHIHAYVEKTQPRAAVSFVRVFGSMQSILPFREELSKQKVEIAHWSEK